MPTVTVIAFWQAATVVGDKDPEQGSCPFCRPDPARAFVDRPLGFALWDAFPVSPGHALVLSREHIPDWWSANAATRVALLDLVDDVRAVLDAGTPRPDGYNVGFNAGAAAGQTVGHLHLHVIPRFRGDVANPTGGVRGVIPRHADYRPRSAATEGVPHGYVGRRVLRAGPSHPLLPAFADEVAAGRITRADLVVAFLLDAGVARLVPHLEQVVDRGGRVRILTTDYLHGTQAAALQRLRFRQVEYGDQFEVRVFLTRGEASFHPKAYLLGDDSSTYRVGFVGSANASVSGLLTGVEWSVESRDAAALAQAREEFERLWTDPRSTPLSDQMVADWVDAPRPLGPRRGQSAASEDEPAELDEPVPQPVRPTPVQAQALDALESTRSDGYGAGLVALATGLGKTWLAAFDSTRPQFRRVLFIAHREEILTQARAVFRKVRPSDRVGMLVAGRGELDASVVMASIQTLAGRLDKISPQDFDYVVVDEFHHAAAPTYRRVVNHLRPRFLLGLTATPDRADGSDILSLCQDNLVFECGPAEGIDRGLLAPFHYHGVPDPVNFAPLPWRNTRFDPEALEHAVITDQRAAAAFREWSQRRRMRTLAFCVSQRHADFMAARFDGWGIRAASVHTGPTSAPRHESLAALGTGELDVIFAVDIFNEGVDLPAIDTVLMLRPTTSSVLFLQQLGRGLRTAPGKDRLVVIDFVGNHRTFLLPLQILAGLGTEGPADLDHVRRALTGEPLQLPAGCRVDYTLEARETLLAQLPKVRGSALRTFVQAWVDTHGTRPTAAAVYRMGGNPAAAPGKWFAFLVANGWLTDDEERRVARAHADLLSEVASTDMTKSYKMVALRAFAHAEGLTHGRTVVDLAEGSRHLVHRDPQLLADVTSKEMSDPSAVSAERWAEWWRKWPLEHLAGKSFTLQADRFATTRQVSERDATILAGLIGELVDWRLAAYHDRRLTGSVVETTTLRVIRNSSGRPILMLNRNHNPGLPSGRDVPVVADGERLTLDFMAIAVNVAHRPGIEGNVLPDLLFTWFGPHAGESGTDFRVRLTNENDIWHAEPVRPATANLAAIEK